MDSRLQQLDSLFHYSHDAILLIDANGGILDVNESARRFLDLPSQSSSQGRIFDYLSSELGSAIKKSLKACRSSATNSALCGELKDGHPIDIWVEHFADTKENQSSSILVTLRSRESIQRLEDQKRDVQEQIRAVFDHAAVGLVHLDPLGRILHVNSWLADRFGISEKERDKLTGQPFSKSHIGRSLKVDDALQSLLRGEKFDRKKVTVRNNSLQKQAVFNIEGIPLFGALGEANGALLILHDTTAESEEAEKRERYLMLESVGAMSGAMTLDFNNLLGAILGHSSYLKTRMDPQSPYYEDIAAIESAARSGAEMIDQLSSWVQPRFEKPALIDLNATIKDVTGILKGAVGRQITFCLELPTDIPTVLAEAVHLKRALIALIINGYEAMPQGGTITIRSGFINKNEAIELGVRDADKGSVWVSVQDTGVGISPNVKGKLFQPFFTTKAKQGAGGLGLVVVKHIIEQLSGVVRFESQVGRGSTFYLYFPAAGGSVDSMVEPLDAIPRGSELVLLVDNEAAICTMGRRLLEAGGYKVMTAQSGDEALRIYRDRMDEVDLVILDLIMQPMSGQELARELLKMNPEVKILLSSGFRSVDGTDLTDIEDVAGFLRKPYRMRHLLQKVRDVLDGKEVPSD